MLIFETTSTRCHDNMINWTLSSILSGGCQLSLLRLVENPNDLGTSTILILFVFEERFDMTSIFQMEANVHPG
jgi:hypothetical protein